MAQSILVIEDEEDIVELLQFNLQREGYQVLTAQDGALGLDLACRHRPNALLLDLMLPDLGGLEILRELQTREETRDICVIVVTAKSEESDIVLGLGLGADDYIVKPFRIKELIARLKAVLKRPRRRNATQKAKVYDLAPLHIDLQKHQVYLDTEEVRLTLTEFRLLETLASSPGRVFSRLELLEQLHGDTYSDERVIDVHITSIRKKLGEHKSLVQTVRGVGYKLSESSRPKRGEKESPGVRDADQGK